MSKIDLHVHSAISSDGEFHPEDIMLRSKAAGLRVVSITDHNSVKGVKRGLKAASGLGLTLIPGIEIDCTYDQENLHLLGYNIDFEAPAFGEIEAAALEQEHAFFPLFIKRLQTIGFRIHLQDVLAESGSPAPSPEFVGEVLLQSAANLADERLRPYRKGGARSDNPYFNFYCDFCTKGKPAYVEKKYPDLITVLQVITHSGGIPILAHPGASLSNPEQQLPAIAKAGVKGLEAFSSYHTPAECHYFVAKAQEYKLLITCGSDFHGKNKPAIALGGVECGDCEQQILAGLMS